MKQNEISGWGPPGFSACSKELQHLKMMLRVRRRLRYDMEWLPPPSPHSTVLLHCTKQNSSVPWSWVKEDEATKSRSKIKEEKTCSWGVLVHKKASSSRAVQKCVIKESMMLLVLTTKKHLFNFGTSVTWPLNCCHLKHSHWASSIWAFRNDLEWNRFSLK